MTSFRLVGCAVVGSACWLAGCDNQPQKVEASGGGYRQVPPPIELVAQGRPPISDLPVPVGFNLDESRSRNFAAAGARYVDHVYRGGADKFAVARFYKRQMPISRWVLVTDMFVQGDIMLDFEKETQRCRIIVAEGSMFHSCHVKVQLWTTGRIQVPGGAGTKGASNR